MPDINVFYRRSEDYKIIPITGAWGGITPQGSISCEVFFEKSSQPEHTVLRVSDSGEKPVEVPNEKQRPEVTREVLVAMIMQPEVARNLGNWLIGKADEFDKLLAKGIIKK